MKIKLINIATGIIIYFAIACIIEFIMGWGMQNKWMFITIWAVSMALADVFVFQKVRQRLAAKKKQQKA